MLKTLIKLKVIILIFFFASLYFFNKFDNGHFISLHFYKQKWRYDLTQTNYKLVVLWTSFYGNFHYIDSLESSGCDHKFCKFTSDKNLVELSDALIIHHRNFDPLKIPKRANSKQIWILLNAESPVHTPHNLHHLNGKINWTATYRHDSEIILQPYFVNRTSSFILKQDYTLDKNGTIVWFVSNCHTSGQREKYIKFLNQTIKVDVYGRCGNLKCMPKMSSKCYHKVLQNYYFYLSFENSICSEYITEKFFNILNYDVVPIVFGGANYSIYAPPHSYINALSFKSPSDLAQYLNYLINNPKEYNRYFTWKKYYHYITDNWACKLCQKLHALPKKVKVYNNLTKWWFDVPCKSWTPNGFKSSKYLYP